MKRPGLGVYLLVLFAPGIAFGQGQKLDTVKIDLPPSPNFNITNAPEQYPSGELSIYGLRKRMAKYMDKDVQVKGFLLEIYECPPELRKCNDDLAVKTKKERKKELKTGVTSQAGAEAKEAAAKGGCRPCDQPHFYMADSATTKKERALLVADYPVKDWNTGKPKPLVAKLGEQYVVTGMYSINSMGGFAASDGLIIHKKLQDAAGAIIAEGNAVLPPDAQDIKLDGKAAEKVGGGRIDANLPQGGTGTSSAPKKNPGDKGSPKEF